MEQSYISIQFWMSYAYLDQTSKHVLRYLHLKLKTCAYL